MTTKIPPSAPCDKCYPVTKRYCHNECQCNCHNKNASAKETVQLFLDGDAWCALIGENIQEGACGFGKTQGDALRELSDALEPDRKKARDAWDEAVRKGVAEGDCVICGCKQ